MQDIRPTAGAGRADAPARLLPSHPARVAPAPAAQAAAPTPLRRGLSNWDYPLQQDISSAQQSQDFLERSASELQLLKGELAAKLSGRQGGDGQPEARMRQFSQSWRTRPPAAGGAGDDLQAITPERWSTADPAASRQTLQQVVQALGYLQRARDSADLALAATSRRVEAVQPPEVDAGIGRLAQDVAAAANQPGYESLLSISSALSGISRERVLSLLRLR